MGQPKPPQRKTTVSIVGDRFYINGKPTFKGRVWHDHNIEGLLPNARMVQGIFDDRNPETRAKWAYPDTHVWDANRNTDEFVAAMPVWKAHGLLAFTLNLQGGSPEGYSKDQPWINSMFNTDGSWDPFYYNRLKKILDKADDLGMVVIVGLFYFGQDQYLKDEAAVVRAVDNTVQLLAEGGYRNVLIEVNNECDIRYDHDILKPERVSELIQRVKAKKVNGYRFLVSTSYSGGKIPKENVVREADFLILHGNGVKEPAKIAEMVQQTRAVAGYRPMPIVFNEDDHFDFDKPTNNFQAATSAYASWGLFDYRLKDEGFNDGYQSPPVNWQPSSPRKKAFFDYLKEITGGLP
ncbi:hypothetical protein EHT25_07270 [Larkinella rosea]|uniref:Glycoside hydrolase family 5 domain-containing protein n=2 Tax=Larkinella rosea TaxID=2025312 RepID=A0A3P1C3X4_9BACT|nr:hypothetical protein EHT25_07270 [Larkinella rosea]